MKGVIPKKCAVLSISKHLSKKSDLVGVTTIHWGPAPESASASIKRWMIGSRKAAVLPEPVCVLTIVNNESSLALKIAPY